MATVQRGTKHIRRWSKTIRVRRSTPAERDRRSAWVEPHLSRAAQPPPLVPPAPVAAGVGSSAAATEATLTLQYTDDGGLVVNEVRLIRGAAGDKFIVSLDGDIRRSTDSTSASYAGRYRGAEWSGLLTFPRLVPEGLPDDAMRIANEVLATLKPLNQVQWLHANRLGNGDGTRETRRARCCLSDGSDLADSLTFAGSASVTLDRLGRRSAI